MVEGIVGDYQALEQKLLGRMRCLDITQAGLITRNILHNAEEHKILKVV